MRSAAIPQPRTSRDLGMKSHQFPENPAFFWFPNPFFPIKSSSSPYCLLFPQVSISKNPVIPNQPITNVKLSKTSEGTLYTRIGTTLTGVALLAIFAYQMLLNHVITDGRTYPSGGIIIASMIMLTFRAVFSFEGARILRSRVALIVPIASTVILLAFFIQWEWCLRYCARP